MQFKTLAIGTALVLSAALPTLAQSGTGTMSGSGTGGSSPTLRELVEQSKIRMQSSAMAPAPGMMTGTMGGPAMGTMGATSMTALSPQDQVFLVRAAEGNLAEISLAQMAMQKSRTPGVRSVAQTIMTGHTQAHNDLMALATRKGMAIRPMLSPTHVAVSERLSRASRAQFDMMYMGNQTDDHENAIALYQTQIANGQDADLKAYAQRYLPDILGHTTMIYTVARQVGAPGSELRPPTPPVPPGVTPTMMPMDGTPAPAM